MSEEINKLNTQIMEAVTELRSTIDAQDAEIKAHGAADALLEEKISRIDTALDAIQDELKAVAKKQNRPSTETSESDDEYKAAYMDWMKGRKSDEEIKSLSIGSPAANAGFTVPVTVDMNIIDQISNYGAMRQLASVVKVSTNDYSYLLNDRATATGWVSESAARPETAGSGITKLPVFFGEVYANVAATQQVIDFSAVDLETWISNEIANSFAVAEGTSFINGTGTNQPKGLLKSSLTSVNSGAAADVTDPDALLTLVYGIKAGHRQGASFLMNSLTEAKVRKLKTTTGEYIWSPGLGGAPSTLLGYSVYTDENMDDVAANKFPIAFGNFKNGYVIADTIGTRMLRDPYTNKPYVMFYATKHVGGRVTDPEALKLLKVSA